MIRKIECQYHLAYNIYIKIKKGDAGILENVTKTMTIRLPSDLHKVIKKTVVDEEKTMGQYFIDLAIKDLEKKGIKEWQKE